MTEDSTNEDPTRQARHTMVREQLIKRGIQACSVLNALERVPRHRFVPAAERSAAYSDHPLPIGAGQTISQPYVVAYMLEQAAIQPPDRVLEIGTGCGYQTALLAELAAAVYSVEVVPELAEKAGKVLAELNVDNVQIRVGDGSCGWPEEAPFDVIIGSAAPPEIPPALLEQLALQGRLVMPVGRAHQQIVLVRRTDSGLERRTLLPVRFVPMV